MKRPTPAGAFPRRLAKSAGSRYNECNAEKEKIFCQNLSESRRPVRACRGERSFRSGAAGEEPDGGIRYRTSSWQQCNLGGTAKSFVPWEKGFFCGNLYFFIRGETECWT